MQTIPSRIVIDDLIELRNEDDAIAVVMALKPKVTLPPPPPAVPMGA